MAGIEFAPMETAYSTSRRIPKDLPLRVRRFSVLIFCGLASMAFAGENPDLARLTYTRVLKGSNPEYICIVLDSDGGGTYEGRRLADPPSPRPLKLSPDTARRFFGLAAELNNFQSLDLESHKKVANLGEKTFTYQKGGQKSSAVFNYTLRREAQELTDLFEKVASVEEHIQTLEYAIKYDHLSLPRELLRIQIDLENKALANPELMIPALEQIASNPRFLHLAKVRAQDILHRVQNTN